jgi:hypothetical protein
MFAPKNGGGFGGIFGGLMGNGDASGGGLLSGLFGGFRANGGPVSSSKGYIVGEKGPEWFQPAVSGAIVPNHKLTAPSANGQSQGSVTVIQNNTFGNGVNRSEINAMIPRIIETTKAAVMDGKRRGGAYGKAFS